MLVGRRKDDEETKTWFRSDRVFHCNGEWFFHTREGIDVGPYDSQFEAEIEAGLLKELLKTLRQDDAPVATIREFILDSFSWGRPLSATYSEDEETRRMGTLSGNRDPKAPRRAQAKEPETQGKVVSLGARRRPQ